MNSDKNTTQEKTKFNIYVYASQCMYNVVKREVTGKVQTKQDKK